MSQSVPQIYPMDPYLAAQVMPPNDLTKIDHQWHTLPMVTPIGRFVFIHVKTPFAIPAKNGRPGPLKYSMQMLFAPGTEQNPIVADLYRGIVAVATSAFPPVTRPDPQNLSVMKEFSAEQQLHVKEEQGGLHFPLRDGNDMYMTDPKRYGMFQGMYFINASMWPQTKAGAEQQPYCADEKHEPCDPGKFYPGCYGRAIVDIASYNNEGKGVTFRLRAVQFARHGERIVTFNSGGFAKSAFENAGAIQGDVGQPPAGWAPGSGFNTASGNPPPGVPYGFAAPPAQAQPQTAQQPQMPPPSRPAQYAGGGARPPGA